MTGVQTCALPISGASVSEHEEREERITKADMFKAGLSGGNDSRKKRLELIKKLDLPEKLSSDALLAVLNALMSRDEFYQITEAAAVSAEADKT